MALWDFKSDWSVSMTGAIDEAQWNNIASATTTDIWAATGNYINVTGTTTITWLGTIQAWVRRTVTFTWVLTITHNATSLLLPTEANIITAVNDRAEFISLWSWDWICTNYQKKDGTALASAWAGWAWTLISTSTPSAVASLTLSLSSSFKWYKIIWNLSPDTDFVKLQLSIYTDWGTTPLSADCAAVDVSSFSWSVSWFAQNSATALNIVWDNMKNTFTNSVDIDIPDLATANASLFFRTTPVPSSNVMSTSWCIVADTDTQSMNAIKFFASSWNISGKLILLWIT